MIRRVAPALGLGLAGSVLVILALVAGLAGTETGTRWLLHQGLDYAPGKAGAARIRGTLATVVHLSDAFYENGDLRLELASGKLDPDWSALLAGRLGIQALAARGLALQLPARGSTHEAEEPASAGETDWPAPAVPLPLSFTGVELKDIRIQQGGNHHAITRLALAGHWRGPEMNLDYLALQQSERHLTLAGKVRFADPWRINTRVAWGLPLPARLRGYFAKSMAFGEGHLRGRLTNLTLEHQLHQPGSVHSQGQIRPLGSPLQLDLEHDWSKLELTLPDGRRLTVAEGELQTRGSPRDYSIALNTGATRLGGLAPLTTKVRAKGNRQSLRIHKLRLQGEPGRLSATGTLAWQPETRWRLALEGRELDPSFLDTRLPGQLALEAQLDGEMPANEPLKLQLDLGRLDGTMRGEPISASGRARMTGTEDVRIAELRLDTAHGRARISGTAGWAPHPEWSLDIAGRNWNPVVLDERLPGRINVDARLSGELPPRAPPAISLELRELGGMLRDQALSGQGELYAQGRDQLRGRMRMQLGANKVTLHGRRKENLDVEVQVDAPELAPVWPELAGSLEGRMRLRKGRAEPRLEGDLQGRNLAFAPWGLERIKLSLEPPDEQGRQQLSVNTGRAERGNETLFSGLELNGQGRRSDHQVNWAVERANHRLAGTLKGGVTDQRWQGLLEALQLSGPLSQTWQQAEAVNLEASPEHLELTELCLQARGHAGRACARGEAQAPDQGRVELDVKAVPLAPFAVFLPSGTGLDGSLNGSAELGLDAGQPEAQARVTTEEGALRLGAGRDEPVRLPWQQFSARARLAGGQWRLAARLQRSETDFVDGHVSGHTGKAQAPLEGRLEARLTDMSWLAVLVPQLREPTGALEGTLALSGTTENPVFDGRMALRDARVRVPEAGLVLRRMHMTASTSDQGRLQFSGGAHSGDGQVRVDGRLKTNRDWPWPLELHLQGQQFLALDRPVARLALTPDLDFTLEGRRLRLRGDLRVPEASFEPRKTRGDAVQVSSDVELVHHKRDADTPWKTDIDVGVTLGEPVRFQGFGLQARFDGDVRYRHSPDQVPRVTGEVRVAEGRYRAYGQRLRIERGRLLFEGAPDNPGLDIIAVRPLPGRDTRVGLKVGGTLKRPDARVFSEPPLEQSEAMALLLTGRSLEGTSRAQSNAILEAVTRYGLERGDVLTNPLSESLGVELGVDSSNELDRTALTLGKQLSERLYVQYSMGLFESLSALMLRYSITPHLSLETSSTGDAQGADLIYRLQRD